MTQSRPRLAGGQTPLIARMKSTNHHKNDSGLCRGIAYKGMLAVLTETLDEFDETMECIYKAELASFPQLAEDSSHTRITAALDVIKIFQSPVEYPGLFTPQRPFITQDNAPRYLIPLLLPQKLEAAGGITVIHRTSGSGRQDKLNDYFDSFSKIASRRGLTKPVAFVISTASHSITLGYLPEQQQWVLINANQLPCEYIDLMAAGNIAEKVMSALMDSDTTAVFSLNAYIQADARPAYKKCISSWKKTKAWKTIHVPNKETCKNKDDNNATWLYLAAIQGCIEQASALIKCGANVNLAEKSGYTPLFIACQEGQTAILKLLIDHGADTSLANVNGTTPLHYVALSGNTDIATLLVEYGADVNLQNKHGESPLHLAIENGFTDIVQLLIEHGANVNLKDENGATPFSIAVQEGDIDTIKLLIAHGADVNLKNKKGATPFSIAVEIGNIDTVKLLIKHGADVNLAGSEKCTPLYIAAQEGRTDVVELLIEHGADVNTQHEDDGTTPLFMATELGHADTVKTLLDHGADCSIAMNQPEKKYIEFCKDQAKEIENRMLQFLSNEYWNSSIEKNRSSVSGCLKWSLFRIHNNYLMNYYQMTPIQIAEVMGHQEIIDLLQTHHKLQQKLGSSLH